MTPSSSGSSFLGTNDSEGGEEAPEAAIKEPEANIPLGIWVRDDPYNEFLTKYLYMDKPGVYKRRQVFAVRWKKDGCAHMWGMAEGGLQGGVPIKVKLSPEDAEVAGDEYLSQRFCPHCHCEIMNGYMEASESRIHHIAFVGGSRAGKTQYLTAAYQNMFEIRSLMNDYHIGTVYIDKLSESVMKYLSELFSGERDGDQDGVNKGEGRIDATQMRAILPVVIRFTPLNPDGELDTKSSSFVAIYDCPGEIFDASNVNKMVSHLSLRKAKALLFIVDPAQLFRDLYNNAREKKEVRQDTCMLNLLSMIQRYSEYFPENSYKAVSFVITKMDQVIDRSVCSLSRDNMTSGVYKKVLQSKDYHDHRNAVDMNIIAHVNNDLRAVLSGTDEHGDSLMTEDIVNLTEKNLTGCPMGGLKVFGVSTHSRPSDDEPFRPYGVANRERHRLLEPLLYLLAELGVVDKKGLNEEPPEDPSPVPWWKRIFLHKDRS